MSGSPQIDIIQHINAGLVTLNSLERKMAAVLLRKCCSSSAWVEEMVVHRPYKNFDHIKNAAIITTKDLSKTDWLEGYNGLPDFSKNNPTIQRLEDIYFEKFEVPYLIDSDIIDSTPENIIAAIETALNDNKTEQQNVARQRLMKTCIRKMANVLASLGDANKPVGFHQAHIENSLLQMDSVPELECHPVRAQFWNGTRLKGLLEWEYQEKDIELWGGVNYHRNLPQKINHVNHFDEKTFKKKVLVGPPRVIPPQKRTHFFGGTFR
jgi:hypothetical protein